MVPPIKSHYGLDINIGRPTEADSIVADLTEKESKLLLDALNKKMGIKEEKKETKEETEKLPELADKNFRVENTKGRKEVTDPDGVKVLENPEGDVREYLEGKNKGEQLFTKDSALRETDKAGETLPPSGTTYEDIIEKKYKGNYLDFLKEEKIIFTGRRHPDNKKLYDIDTSFALRCADGSFFNGRVQWDLNNGKKNIGYSVRCFKKKH